MELPLILRLNRKRKKRARDICKGILDIEFEGDWSVGLDHGCANHDTEGKLFTAVT